MRTRPSPLPLASISAAVGLATVWLLGAIPISRERGENEIGLRANRVWAGALPRGSVAKWRTDVLDPAALYTFSASLDTASLRPDDRCEIRLEGPGSLRLGKALHAGDPSYFITFRPRAPGAVVAQWEPSRAHPEGPPVPLRLELRRVESSGAEQVAFEAEPNDSWQEANPLVLGRTVYGGGDDIEYLDNEQEYKIGWDWFRIDFDETEPKLVYFELDLPDRDIPLQLLFYRHNPATGSIEPYARGRDPMEVLHDGQKVRYSKFITRVLSKGRYYLAVLANHPFYLLRTTLYPVPPYTNPQQAVETAMHYALGIGDAWFAQVPRLGSRHRRSVMLHDEAQRCTACHPTVFTLESNLTAFKQGYPIRAKSQFHYLMQRVYNAPTPLYGNPGVNWVRFVGIELQFFGKQGGLVSDYENWVTGRPTPFLGRFTGFLQAAWDHRDTLPDDENNGVSPIDSKFGFAWRDWRVLSEMARRTGDRSLQTSADHIAGILSSPDSSRRIEGTQDRLHRLHALALIDRRRNADEIAEGVRYFLARQNPDGGWPGNDEKPSGGSRLTQSSESVEYLTGQTIHTLLAAGVTQGQRARLDLGARWLLSRQQEFGGWFQTETIENFVTPMRETRYAVMALATLYPRGPQQTRGLGNRDAAPARLPRTKSIAGLLDDLDNLWEAPEKQPSELVARIAPLLDHENSFVRALAAQCLGRIGNEACVPKLIARFQDPEKMVWQSAAWALRQLGNRGIGVEAVRAALSSPSSTTRRGAARIFAYQFYGMDERRDLLEAFFPLLSDPDVLTRHQAVDTLAQWWYRSPDREIRRRIFQSFIDRLADPGEHPLQRFYLSQGLYNLLDENLGSPGTGYGRWIDYLKPEQQTALRAERRRQEREILLKPILAALKDGPPLQRIGVLLGFDGTPFWRGYTTAAFGPGNDRAFDFESGKEIEGLGEAFRAVLSRRDSPEELRYGLLLGAFFDVFKGKEAQQLVPLYLDALTHSEAKVRDAAAQVADKVSLAGIEASELARRLRAHPTAEIQAAAIKMLRQNSSLLEDRELADFVRRRANDPNSDSSALPLLASAAFGDAEALSALTKTWPRSLPGENEQSEAYRELERRNSLLSRQALEQSRRSQTAPPPPALLDCLTLLEKRPGLLEKPEVVRRLVTAASSDNGRVRQIIVELFTRQPALRNNPAIIPAARASLIDSRPELRRAALELARVNEEIAHFPEFFDLLLQLLVDSDAKVRKAALDLVQQRNLIARDSRLAGRVKALEEGEPDETMRNRAGEALRQAGLDPALVRGTANLAKPVVPDFEIFKRIVNSYFYQESARDGRACAHCHATHRIFRLTEPPAAGGRLSEQQLENNYHSILKVVDVYEPERSLVLRKPLSPSGQGEQDAASPTGLTHVGGTRWNGTEDPAYQAIVRWLRSSPP